MEAEEFNVGALEVAAIKVDLDGVARELAPEARPQITEHVDGQISRFRGSISQLGHAFAAGVIDQHVEEPALAAENAVGGAGGLEAAKNAGSNEVIRSLEGMLIEKGDGLPLLVRADR